MIKFSSTIETLPANRGGYAFFEVDKKHVQALSEQHKTRVICEINKQLTFKCGFSHLGNGNFLIIISKTKLKTIAKLPGDKIEVTIKEDPNKLGADIPESLMVLLAQDSILKRKYDSLTDGNKRNLIRYVSDTKNIERQIERAIYLLNKYGK